MQHEVGGVRKSDVNQTAVRQVVPHWYQGSLSFTQFCAHLWQGNWTGFLCVQLHLVPELTL